MSDDDIYLYDFCRNSERKRKERARLVYERKKQLNKLRMKAEKAVEEKLDPHGNYCTLTCRFSLVDICVNFGKEFEVDVYLLWLSIHAWLAGR